MKTETMISALRELSEKHKNDKIDTFDTNWSLLCFDVANKLEELTSELTEHDKQITAEVVEFISDKLIYPLLDEYDRGLWEHISHIDLAKEWIKVLDDNPYPKVKNHTEARKKELRQWIAEQLREQNK